MRALCCVIGVMLVSACGSAGDGAGGGGGTGGAGGSGGVSGDPLCVAAYEYLREEPCASDANITAEDYTFDLEGCTSDSRVCANCVKNQRYKNECVVGTSCQTFCNKLR